MSGDHSAISVAAQRLLWPNPGTDGDQRFTHGKALAWGLLGYLHCFSPPLLGILAGLFWDSWGRGLRWR